MKKFVLFLLVTVLFMPNAFAGRYQVPVKSIYPGKNHVRSTVVEPNQYEKHYDSPTAPNYKVATGANYNVPTSANYRTPTSANYRVQTSPNYRVQTSPTYRVPTSPTYNLGRRY